MTTIDTSGSIRIAGLGPPPPPLPAGDATASLLGMSADDLETALKSGQPLSDLATTKGVSQDDLVASIAKDLKASKPEGAPDLSDDQLTQMATGIATGKGPQRPPRADNADSNLQSLADDLGVDPQELLEMLEKGLGKDLGEAYGEQKVTSGVKVDCYA